MMGTGEATGDKRALTAAEAAIANPLIDEFSMKGARGLLISITGGKDLTLFEVDEAATRIREEVDQDANIIVGATFDETLDGMIRVSVVATGIEQAQIARNQAAAPAVATTATATHVCARQSSGRTDRSPARRQCAPGRTRPEARAFGCAAGTGAGRGCRAGSAAPAPARQWQRRTRGARCDCRGGRTGARAGGLDPAGVLWRRHGSPDRAEADAVPGSE